MEPIRSKEVTMAGETQEGSQLANELLERIGAAVGRKADASTVFGDPVQREGVTVIPVAKARFGFGGGGGSGTRQSDPEGMGSGGGGGGGVAVAPIGYIEVHDGSAEFKRIRNASDVLALVAAGSLVALTIRRLIV
jgi:uncharacterized spore protein YtfJ